MSWFRFFLAAAVAAKSGEFSGSADEPRTEPVLAAASAPTAGGEAKIPGVPAAEALTSAKLAEEGDGDVPRALVTYRQVVARYDVARKEAAEALFRIGELTREQQPNTEARTAYERLVAEFASEGDWAARATERLGAMGDGTEPTEPAQMTMSPELMRRYGLLPKATSAAPAESGASAAPEADRSPEPNTRSGGAASTRPAMSPELMKRYGLTAPPGAKGRYGAGTRFSMSPELMRRYGLLGPTAEPAPAAEAAVPATTATASAPPSDPAVEAEIRDAEAELSQLRSEAAQLNAQVRALRREIAASAGIEENRLLDLLPLQLVKDPIFLKEMEDYRLQITALVHDLEEASSRAADEKTRSQLMLRVGEKRSDLGSRFRQYQERLERQVTVLRREFDILKAQINQRSDELQKSRASRR